MLDEPLAYLDREARRRLLDLIGRLAAAGKGILIFEHRRDLVRPAATIEVCMEEGGCAPRAPETPHLLRLASSRPGPERLVMENVTMAWPRSGKALFSDVSLTVRAAESVVLAGENGSGKTTLLSMALGLLRPSAGVITTNGQDTRRAVPERLAREAALIFQHPDHQLYLGSVGEEVRLSAPDEKTAAFELDAMGLSGLADRHPRSLSMGQKRRLTIAAALARRPTLLLLDEPSVGQDDRSLALVLRRLEHFVGEGGALLTATHDERAARALGHRTYRLQDGALRESEATAAGADDHRPWAGIRINP
jgi:energy-coupling factor transport system ATP-binding protein